MTDPRDPKQEQAPEEEPRPGIGERVGEAVERVEERVEHAVDEVVEEVVEHVPEPIRAPVRWTVRKLALVIVLSVTAALVVGALATAYYVWNHTSWASHELTWRVNQVLREHSDVTLSVDGLRGNPLAAVEVVHPRVTFREGGSTLLEARAMTLRYSTWNLFAGKRGTLVIDLDRPVVRLERGPDGALHLPEWRSKPGAKKAGRGFDYEVRIHGGDVALPEPERSVKGFDLDAAVATGGLTSVEIRSLSWKDGPYGMPLTRLTGSISAGDSVVIQVRQLESPPLALKGDARWLRGDRRTAVHADVARVQWRWLARVFRNRTFDVPGEVALSLSAQRDFGWTGETRARGTWGDLPLSADGSFAFRDGKLAVSTLSGRSPAGELSDGRLAWSKAGWELSGRARRADPSRWEVIGLKGWPAGALEGRFRYAVDTRATPNSMLEATLEPSTLAGWRADSGLVRVYFPPDAPDSFRVVATRRGGRLTLAGRTDPSGWTGSYAVRDFPLDEWPDGRATGLSGTLASGEGTVDGRQGGLFLTGALEGRSTRWFGLDAARWRLDDVKGRLLPTPALEARARLTDVLYLGLHFDSLATPVDLGDRTLNLPALAAWAGDTVATMAMGAAWDEGSWRMTADQAVLRSRRFDWRSPEPVRLSGNREGVTFEHLVAQDGDARLEIQGRWGVPGGSYDWRGSVRGLRLERLGLPDSLRFVGVADADLAVRGASGDPRWEFQSAVGRPGMQGRLADSLRIQLAGSRGFLDVRHLAFGIGSGWIEAQGQFRDAARAWPDTLTPDGVTRWLAGAASWSGHATARSLALEKVARAMRSPSGWTGLLDGSLDLAGRPARPEARLDLTARPLAWGNLHLDQATVRARFADEHLVVEQLRGNRDQAVSDVTGEMEVQLAFGQEPKLLDAPMRWHVDLPNGDLALLSVLVPQIGSAAGRFVVHGDVAGTPRHPEIQGTARVDQGRLRFAGREEVLEDVSARLTFAASRITLDSLSGVQRARQGEIGRVSAHGAMDLPAEGRPHYRFDVSLRNFTAVETGLYAARFDGDFAVTDGVKVGDQVLPHITSDNVEIDRAVILYDFTRQTEAQQVQASTQKLYWTYRIRVHATDNLRWQPSDGDIEFSADLNLDQTPEKLVIFGDMEALRGTYYFLSNRFTVDKATLTFDDVRGVDPVVDAEATTRLTPSQPLASGALGSDASLTPKPYVITVRITGRSSQPVVEFDSTPTEAGAAKLDQAQILRELTVGRFVTGDPGALVDPFNSYLTRAISRQLSGELSRAFRGYLTDWEIARESREVGGGLVLGVGSQLNNRLAVRYRQLLPGTGRYATTGNTTNSLIERDIEAEYRINRFFYITSQLTQKRTAAGTATSVSGTPDFNVNLKARWEY